MTTLLPTPRGFFFTIAATFGLSPLLQAEVKLPALFSDHMVLQSGQEAPVWGWAAPGEAVTVSFGKTTAQSKAGPDGRWTVKLGTLEPSSTPGEMMVRGDGPAIRIRDVLVGEVWLASGQSNMAFLFSRGEYPAAEKAAATHPGLRMFTVKAHATRQTQTECGGEWVVCSPESVDHFSAVAYFFGRDLHKELGRPVGMINSSWGGTDIAAWTSAEAQQVNATLKANMAAWEEKAKTYDPAKAKAAYQKATTAWKARAAKAAKDGSPAPKKPRVQAEPARDPNHPANLYNGMIAPLIPYALKGAIWYQGEHNCSSLEKATLYSVQLPMLISDWRKRWGYDLAFAWVQLPNFEQSGFRPLVREAMLKSLAAKNTGMAVTLDVGEAHDNHPKNKAAVARRLSYWALGTQYQVKVPAVSGPLPTGHEVRGDAIVIQFNHTEGGLKTLDGAPLKGFQIAGADKVWHAAEAIVEGGGVKVTSAKVAAPVAVRHAWDDNPQMNLCNGAGLPASPFRTDDWTVESTEAAAK